MLDPEIPVMEVLRTFFCTQDIDSYLDGLLNQLNFTPQNTAKLAKLAKATKQNATALILTNQKIDNLQETADRQEKKKKLLGPKNLFLNKNCTFKLAAELESKQEKKIKPKNPQKNIKDYWQSLR